MSGRWLAWLALAAALLGLGVVLGEPGQILLNAASVCLACMGIG